MLEVKKDSGKCECGNYEPIETTEHIVCRNCGEVIEDQIFDQMPFIKRLKRGSDSEFIVQNHPVTIPVKYGCRTAFQITKEQKERGKFFRLQRMQASVIKSEHGKKRIIKNFLPLIKQLIEKYRLSVTVQDEVLRNLIKIQELGSLKGRNATLFVYALLHIICRSRKIPHYIKTIVDDEVIEIISPFYNLKQIAKVEKVPLRQLNKTFALCCNTLNIKTPLISISEQKNIPVETQERFIYNKRQELLKAKIENTVQSLITQDLVYENIRNLINPYIPLMEKIYFSHRTWSQRDPKWVVGGFLYLYQQKIGLRPLTQDNIARAIGNSEVTLRTYIKTVMQVLTDLKEVI